MNKLKIFSKKAFLLKFQKSNSIVVMKSIDYCVNVGEYELCQLCPISFISAIVVSPLLKYVLGDQS